MLKPRRFTSSLTNACSSNTGTVGSLYVSVVLPAGTTSQFVAARATIAVCAFASVLPDWWRADICRTSAVTVDASASIGGTCPTVWDGHAPAITAFSTQLADPGPIFEPWNLAAAIAPADAFDLTGDGVTERSVFRLTISRAQTTGAGSCAGCSLPAWINLRDVAITDLNDTPATELHLYSPAYSTVVSYNGGGYCIPDPVKNRTWGSIKSMYR